jgi:hypothetical protein
VHASWGHCNVLAAAAAAAAFVLQHSGHASACLQHCTSWKPDMAIGQRQLCVAIVVPSNNGEAQMCTAECCHCRH